MNQIEVKELAAEKNVAQKASHILNACQLQFVELMDINIPGMCYGIEVVGDQIYVSSVVRKNGGIWGEVYGKSLSGNSRFQKIIGEISLRYPSIPICCNADSNAILYVKANERRGTCIVRKNLKTGDESVFGDVPGVIFENISSLRLFDSHIAATDPLTNTAAFFGIDGNFIRAISFSPQVQCPICIEKLNGVGLLAGFLNKHCIYGRIESKADADSPKTYLAVTDDNGTIRQDITSVAEHVFTREPIVSMAKTEDGSFFILTARHLVKLDNALNAAFYADLPIWTRRICAFESELPGNSNFLGMACSGGRLFLMESMACKKILVFESGKSGKLLVK